MGAKGQAPMPELLAAKRARGIPMGGMFGGGAGATLSAMDRHERPAPAPDMPMPDDPAVGPRSEPPEPEQQKPSIWQGIGKGLSDFGNRQRSASSDALPMEWINPDRFDPAELNPPINYPGFNAYPFGGYRALGGQIDPYRRYIVGEGGPEQLLIDDNGNAMVDPLMGGRPKRRRLTAPDMQPARDKLMALQPPPMSGQSMDIPPAYSMPSGESLPGQHQYTVGDDIAGNPKYRRPGVPDALTGLSPQEPFKMEAPQAIEPSKFGGPNRNVLPDNATPLERIEQDIQDRQLSDARSEKSFWKRLGQGLSSGLQEWVAAGSPGGMYGALGALGAGAAIHGISKDTGAGMRKNADLRRLFGEYQRAATPQMMKMEMMKQQAGVMGAGYDAQKKKYDALHSQYGTVIDQLKAQKYTPAQIAAEMTARGIPMIEQDVREYDTIYGPKGEAYSVPKTGPQIAVPNETMPINPDAVRREFTITENGRSTTLTISDKDAAKMITDLKQAEATAQRQQAEFQYRQDKDKADRAWDEWKFKASQQDKMIDRKIELLKAKSGLISQNGAAQTAYSAMLGHKTAMDIKAAELANAKDEAEAGPIRKEYTDEAVKFFAAEGQFKQAIQGTQGAQEMLDLLNTAGSNTSQSSSATPSYSPKGRTYQSPRSLKKAFPGKTTQQIKKEVEAAGGRFLTLQ